MDRLEKYIEDWEKSLMNQDLSREEIKKLFYKGTKDYVASQLQKVLAEFKDIIDSHSKFIYRDFYDEIKLTPNRLREKKIQREHEEILKTIISYKYKYYYPIVSIIGQVIEQLNGVGNNKIKKYEMDYRTSILVFISEFDAQEHYLLFPDIEELDVEFTPEDIENEKEHIELPGFSIIVKVLSRFKHLLDTYKELQEGTLGKNLPKATHTQKSYMWMGNEKELVSLYQKTQKLLKTTKSNFIKVFNGSEITKITPIKWNSDSPSQVIFFIITLMDEEMIEKDYTKQKKERFNYAKLKSCFVKPNGEQFDQNLKSLKFSIYENTSQSYQDEITSLVKSLDQ